MWQRVTIIQVGCRFFFVGPRAPEHVDLPMVEGGESAPRAGGIGARHQVGITLLPTTEAVWPSRSSGLLPRPMCGCESSIVSARGRTAQGYVGVILLAWHTLTSIQHLQRRAADIAAVILMFPEEDVEAFVNYRDGVAFTWLPRAPLGLGLLPAHAAAAARSHHQVIHQVCALIAECKQSGLYT